MTTEKRCSVCGGEVYLRKVATPRRAAQAGTPVADERVCSDPACGTNGPSAVRLGLKP